MFPNATFSSRSSSSRSDNSSSMLSLRMRSPLAPKTSFNPIFRPSDALTSFDASHYVFLEKRKGKKEHKKAVLRRFHSHDSHTNFCDINIESFDNNIESKCKSDVFSHETSPDSLGDRKPQEYEARDFLERFSLPRVVRVEDGEPILLYRCFDSFTKIMARSVTNKRGREKPGNDTLYFPEGYNGWFSLINEKGDRCAVAYTSVLQLVREQVCSFISIQPFNAYAGYHPDPSETSAKFQYLKIQVKPGQLFQLRAVFQHRDSDNAGRLSTKSTKHYKLTKDKDLANRYAQLISQNNQELYVPLTTKGEFYEIHSSVKSKLCFHGMLDKTGPLALDKDCLYKLTHLLRRVTLPIKVKLLSGSLPSGLSKEITDTFILELKVQEPLMVTCTLPAPTDTTKHVISCINLNSDIKLSRCMLGFDTENRLFKSQRLQAALAFCHKNVETWYREVKLAPNIDKTNPSNKSKDKTEPDKSQDEPKEETRRQLITKEILEKFPKPKKWYKHFKILSIGKESADSMENGKEHMDAIEKVKSIDRYKDMSKLIEETFVKKQSNPVKKSASFMFSTKRIDLDDTPDDYKNSSLLKCQSLDMQLHSIEENKSTISDNKFKNSKSNISDSLSYDFQMCILENDNDIVENKIDNRKNVEISNEEPSEKSIKENEIKQQHDDSKLTKIKPDLIPNFPKDENSFITERLCTEFHVKTKIQHRSVNKHSLLSSKFEKSKGSLRVNETAPLVLFNADLKGKSSKPNVKLSVVEIHEDIILKNKPKLKTEIPEDIPYSNVIDEVNPKSNRKNSNENIYAEICDSTSSKCDTNSLCKCENNHKSEYCYLKLGSNDENVTSNSNEAIYNTLS